ncbi:unnamed protein product [Mesocestoides corti]|uniref:OB domain-containing protein n=1 Tax=Mesocestoides corti TaxID=53468 RepID=A0A0R3U1A8_MESCO|nr:unnamed protein product [Mesocestoides corti]
MSKEAPPIMRKLLIGQLKDLRYEAVTSKEGNSIHSVPFTPGRQLLFSLVWLQGRVLGTASEASILRFLLDDATGSVLVTIQPDTQPPTPGSYVSVVGEVERVSGTTPGPCGDLTPSIVSWQISARSVMSLSQADKCFCKDDDATGQRTPSSVYAELAWPLEVMDMSQNFWAPT